MSGVEGINARPVELPSVADSSARVMEAKTALVDLEYDVDRTGFMDERTRSALANFQSRERLQYRDGRFDAGTLFAAK